MSADLCLDCGREWPSRLGRHNCEFRRLYVHKRAILLDPGASLLEAVKRFTDRRKEELCRSAESSNLGGYDSPYPDYLNDIDASIGLLKQFRAEVQALAKHAHDWDGSDYCSVCGADGRA